MTSTLAWTGLCATAGYLAIFCVLHVLPTGYNAVHHAVSDYAIGRYGWLFRVGLWLSAVGVFFITIALLKGVGSPPLPRKDVVFLLLVPLARYGMTLYPTDLEGAELSRAGLRHYALAIAAFTFTYLAISETTSLLRSLEPARWFDAPLHVIPSIVAVELTLVVLTMIPTLRRVFGLFERLFLLTTNAWFLLVAALLIARAP